MTQQDPSVQRETEASSQAAEPVEQAEPLEPTDSQAQVKPESVQSPETGPADAAAEPGADDAGASPDSTKGPEQPVPPGPGLTLDDLAARVDRVEQAVTGLRDVAGRTLAILEDRANFDRARESAVDKMHDELTAFKQKGLDHSKKEVLHNLLVLYDNIEQCTEAAEGKERETLDWLREMLLETLYREDVEPLDEASVEVRRELHKVVGTVPTDDPESNLKIERVVKKGFRWHGDLLRPAHVVVRRCQAQAEPPSE